MNTTTKLNKDASGKDVEKELYRSMIGNLLYPIVSHPNISFVLVFVLTNKQTPKSHT